MTATDAVRPLEERAEAPGWQVWTNLWIVYVVWGSTYLAISFMVETLPPLLAAGVRFLLVGLIVLPIVAIRHGLQVVRPTRRQLLACAGIGVALPGANAIISVAEQTVPSGLAALLVASIPLWVIILRRVSGDRIPLASLAAVLVGFAGVALVVKPESGESILAPLACVAAAALWAVGSFMSPRIDLPRNPLASTGWQSLLGGLVCVLAGLIAGEGGDVHPAAWSLKSLLGLAYLITFGSLLAFTAYAWLLQNAPISKVSTYAYVNPVIAIALGWLLQGESISAQMLAGSAIVVLSVALVIRVESRR